MSEKKFGKRLLTWVLVLVMTLSMLPVSALAASDYTLSFTEGTGSDPGTYKVFYSVNGGELTEFSSSMSGTYRGDRVSILFFVAPAKGYAVSKITHDGNINGDFYSIVDRAAVTDCEYYKHANTSSGVIGNGCLTAAQVSALIQEARGSEYNCVAAFQYSIAAGHPSRSISHSLSFYTEELPTLTKDIVKVTRGAETLGANEKVQVGDIITYSFRIDYHKGVSGGPLTYTSVTVKDEKLDDPYIGFPDYTSSTQAHSEIKTADYTVKATDIVKGTLTNIAELSYAYESPFNESSGSDSSTSEKEIATYSSVFYQYEGVTPSGAPDPSEYNEPTIPGGTPVAVADEPTLHGYTFSGWETGDASVRDDNTFLMPESDVTFTGHWTANKHTLTVHYVYADGSKAEDDYTDTAAYDSSYEIDSPTIDGYTPSPACVSGTMPDEDVEVTVTYTKRGDYSYTVNYYWNGTTEKVSASKIVENQTFGEAITEFPIDIPGCTPISGASAELTISSGENVIDFYYYKNVALTANSDSCTYDGEAHTVSGFVSNAPDGVTFDDIDVTGATGINVGAYPVQFAGDPVGTVDASEKYIVTEAKNGTLTINKRSVTLTSEDGSKVYDGTPLTKPGVTVTGSFVGEQVSNIRATGSVTNVSEGTVSNTITFDTTDAFDPGNYDITKDEGELSITPDPTVITVTITGRTDTKTYNGSAQSVTGYDVSIDSDLYRESDISFTGTAAASGIAAGSYSMGLSKDDFANSNRNFSNVKFDVTDGSLTIGKRSVTLTSETASKVFDGTPLTRPDVTVTGDGFVAGEVSDIRAAGTVTNVGSVTNTIEYTKGEAFSDDNYDIIKNEGTLTVTAAAPKEFTLTVEYVYANGGTAAPSHTASVLAGAVYSVNSPVVSGYTADKAVVSGVMPSESLRVTVTYTRNHRPGGGTSRPSAPTIEIDDDDALGLNTTDHFAYIVGYGNGEVRPQNNITRAEVATIFFRLLTDDVRDANLSKTNRYSDVAGTAWYNTAVSTLSAMGIITGYPDGTFRPNAAITRAEFAAIAARFDTNGDKTTAAFTDIASHWAKDEISVAANNGWIKGYEDNTFRPQRDITRAETMTLVNRVLNRQPETEDDLLPNMTVWTDNADKNAWYYLAVQEATNSHYYEFKTNSQYEKWTELRETRDWTQLEK